MTFTSVLHQARSLSREQRKELIQQLVDDLDFDSPEKTHSILEFEGIGEHLADEEDPQDYVNRIRSEWDERP
ncbi:MAG: hypothetical protein ACOYL5_09490 [Phototrophicaceae bacterium]|jgi:hypothetical protein